MQTTKRYTQEVTVGMLASRRTVVALHTQKVTEPMVDEVREAGYFRQNRRTGRASLTDRQVRQLERMQNRSFFRSHVNRAA